MASQIRRKPQNTYKSPSAEDRAYISSSLAGYSRVFSPSTTPKPAQSPNQSAKAHQNYDLRNTRRRYSMTPSLPLFHPFGRLAMSLPPLDPTRYGLPVLAVPDEPEPKPSMRVRRPATKPQEVEDEVPANSPSVNAIAAVAAQEVKERPSPRKRRAGGGKRKRKDVDDGDATYPAKRTRIPRGTAGQGVDDESGADGAQPEEGETALEPVPDLSDSAKRRSTRAKGSLKRRDSSASETSGSGKATVNGVVPDTTSSPTNADIPQKTDSTAGDLPAGDNDKEEGELSEEHTGTS